MAIISNYYNSKWISTAASIWIQCSCGASYAFGIYSPLLKSTQGYDQSTLDTLSVFKDIGANAGVLSGLLYSSYLMRRSVWVVHAAGAIQCFAGYMFLWLAVTGRIERPHVAVTCLLMFLAAHAQTFFNTGNVVTAVRNFPDYSGTIVGIMKGFLGLSGAVLIQIYQALFPGKPSIFILMLALMPTLISLVLMFFVKVHDHQSTDDKTYLNGYSLISISVAAYLMFLIFIDNIIGLSQWARALTLTILLILLTLPLHVSIKAQNHDSTKLPSLKDPLVPKLENSPTSENPANITSEDDVREAIITGQEQLNILQAMKTLNFWLLFVAMLCGMGSGLATINNISQIGESLGYTTKERSTLVSLWSIWNFLGRFGAGYISDIMMHRFGWARPLVMILTLATMAIGYVIIALGFPGNLYIGSLLVGVCYGSQWSLMPTIASEVFGVLHMGTIFNTIAIASPLGSYILSVRVIGYIYDREGSGTTGNSCSGTHCFMLSFFILASVGVLGSLVALALLVKTREVYARIIRRRSIMWD